MSKRKVILLCVSVMLVVLITVLGTLAYLTDRATVKNTFTVGDVDITLDETDVDGDGRTDDGNEYHLVPGESYTKDPTVTVKAGSEESYVRMIMTVKNCSAVQAIIDNAKNGLTDYADLFSGWDDTTWLYEGYNHDADANTISFEFRYKETVAAATADEELEPLFTELVVPGALTNAELKALYENGFEIVVEGHAIQAATFANATEAWDAFEAQIGA